MEDFKNYIYERVKDGLIEKEVADKYFKKDDRFKNTDKYSINQLRKIIINDLKANKDKKIDASFFVKKLKVDGRKINMIMNMLERDGKIRFVEN